VISHINERTPRRIRRDLRGITFRTRSLRFPGTGWGMSMERVIGPTRDERERVCVCGGGEAGEERKRGRSKPTGGRGYQAIRIIHKNNTVSITASFIVLQPRSFSWLCRPPHRWSQKRGPSSPCMGSDRQWYLHEVSSVRLPCSGHTTSA